MSHQGIVTRRYTTFKQIIPKVWQIYIKQGKDITIENQYWTS